MLAEAKDQTGLPIVTECMDVRDLDGVLEVADVIQIGARNMQNYSLLTEVGRSGHPVLIKRGLSSTLDELLSAAEYVLKEGNDAVILCERGIRTFETAYRFTLDLTAIPVLKERTHLPVIVDPSHAAGRRELVEPLSLAAAAVGADGIIVEVHLKPGRGDLRRPAVAPHGDVRRLRRAAQRRRGAHGQDARDDNRARRRVSSPRSRRPRCQPRRQSARRRSATSGSSGSSR